MTKIQFLPWIILFVATAVSAQTKYGGPILNGKAVSLPSPEYPAAARAIAAGGNVRVAVVVGKNGLVKSAKAVSGHPLLRVPAENAAFKAQFKPFTILDRQFEIRGLLLYRFTAGNSSGFPVTTKIETLNTPILNGAAVSLPKPKYPKAASDNCITGLVEVKVSINESGRIISAVAVRGNPVLRKPAVDAAKAARFSRKPQRKSGYLVYNFDFLGASECK